MATNEVDSVTITEMTMVCVDDFERYAEKCLDSATLGYIQGGSDEEITLRDNVAAFRR